MDRTLASAVVLLAVLAAASAWAQAQSGAGYRVIVHPSNPQASIERRLLTDMFLKKATRWRHGESIRPVDQTADRGARRRFSEDVLRRSVSAVKSYWQQAIFSGRGIPPAELESDEAVVQFVLKYRGAIGYVSASAGTGDAKAIAVR